MKLPLKWEFPGGKLEEGETPEQCLHREIKEELNIEVSIIARLPDSVFTSGDTVINLIPFTATYLSGEIILLEHLQFKWLARNDLLNLDWADADIPVLHHFLKLLN